MDCSILLKNHPLAIYDFSSHFQHGTFVISYIFTFLRSLKLFALYCQLLVIICTLSIGSLVIVSHNLRNFERVKMTEMYKNDCFYHSPDSSLLLYSFNFNASDSPLILYSLNCVDPESLFILHSIRCNDPDSTIYYILLILH